MFSLVIVAISIGLVALLAMVALYYGGSVWASQQVNATAATVNNQGTQYRAALMLYAEQNSGSYPAALSDLVPTYLASRPVPPKQAYTDESHEPAATDWGPGPNNSIGVWVRNQVSRAVCDTVNVQAGYIAEGIPRFVDPAKVVQCFQDATWVAATEGGDTTAPEKFTALYLIKAAPADICTAMSVENINCNPTGGTPVTVPPAGPTGGEPTCSAGTELVTGTGWFVSACRPPSVPSTGGGAPSACSGTEPMVSMNGTGTGNICVTLGVGQTQADITASAVAPNVSVSGEFTLTTITCVDNLCNVSYQFAPSSYVPGIDIGGGLTRKSATATLTVAGAPVANPVTGRTDAWSASASPDPFYSDDETTIVVVATGGMTDIDYMVEDCVGTSIAPLYSDATEFHFYLPHDTVGVMCMGSSVNLTFVSGSGKPDLVLLNATTNAGYGSPGISLASENFFLLDSPGIGDNLTDISIYGNSLAEVSSVDLACGSGTLNSGTSAEARGMVQVQFVYSALWAGETCDVTVYTPGGSATASGAITLN